MQKFGEKLKVLRTHHAITLSELALKLGLSSHSYLSELESGKKKPTVELVINVSRLFNISTDDLLKDEIIVNPGKLNE